MDEFSEIQFISISNLLYLDAQGAETDIAKPTAQALTDLESFQTAIATHTESETETEKVIGPRNTLDYNSDLKNMQRNSPTGMEFAPRHTISFKEIDTFYNRSHENLRTIF